MGQFSDDGQWWWDDTTWIATANVVLPQLPPTAFEQSGKVEIARGRLRKTGWLSWIDDAGCALSWLAAIPYSSVTVPALRDYRLWRLEQLAAATAYLLGPNEPMMAGEATIMPRESIGDSSTRDVAVAVTAAHVLLFGVDTLDGQPRWVVLAARPTDVNMEERSFLRAGFLGGPALTVSRGNAEWVIRGSSGVFERSRWSRRGGKAPLRLRHVRNEEVIAPGGGVALAPIRPKQTALTSHPICSTVRCDRRRRGLREIPWK